MSKIYTDNIESFLVNILFDKKKIQKKTFSEINYEKLVKFSSSHLMLPAVYSNLLKKNYINYVPTDFRRYIKEIYRLNSERNKQLINEINEISETLQNKKINHVFLKGAANLFTNIYDQLGDRMIGDIDILVKNNDVNEVYELVKRMEYHTINPGNNLISDTKHIKKMVNENKIFAVEIHRRLLDNRINKHINHYEFLEKKIICEGICVPSKNDQLIHNIYNHQINDKGNIMLSYSYRSLYDNYLIIKSLNQKNLNIPKTSIVENYFMIASELNIPILKDYTSQKRSLNLGRFRLKKNNKTYFKFEKNLINLYLFFNLKFKQIGKLIGF